MPDNILNSAQSKMDKGIEYFQTELKSVRTGRANISLLDSVKVDYYGSMSPLSTVASIAAPEARLLTVQPWDASLLPQIEKAINASNLGLNPSNDGKIIRLPIPALTEDRRKEFVKQVRKMAEDCKVVIRNERRSFNDRIKKLEKGGEITEDDEKDFYDKIQKLTDKYVAEIDQISAKKEKDIMEI